MTYSDAAYWICKRLKQVDAQLAVKMDSNYTEQAESDYKFNKRMIDCAGMLEDALRWYEDNGYINDTLDDITK